MLIIAHEVLVQYGQYMQEKQAGRDLSFQHSNIEKM